MMTSALILDLILLAVLILFIVLGAHRGLVLTLCGLLAIFVAFFGAAFVSDTFCEPMADILQPSIESRLETTLRQALKQETSHATETIPNTGDLPLEDLSLGDLPLGNLFQEKLSLDDLPLEKILKALEGSGVYQSLTDSFQQAVRQDVVQITGSAVQALSRYIAQAVARAVLFVLAFLIILIAWTLLSHALDLVAKLPVLSTINRVGGGIVGAVKGYIILCVGVWFFHTVLSLIPPQVAQNSYLLPLLSHSITLVQ